MQRFRTLRVGAVIAVSTVALAACGGSGTATTTAAPAGDATTEIPATTAAPAAAAAAVFPVTIDHAFGSTTVESQPERVATVHWGNHDVPVALGIVPVGMQFNTFGDDDGDGVLPWTFAALEGLGGTGDNLPLLFDEVDGVDFEGVADVAPDVVLAAYSGLTEEDWSTLEEIAPTVAYPQYAWGTNWRDMALVNGAALGLRAEAEALVADVEAQIAAALEARPTVPGTTVAYTWIDTADTSNIWVYSPIDARVQLLSDLGMAPSQGVIDLLGDSTDFSYALSAENADTIADADVLVTYGNAETTLATLQADPLIGQIPAVASGAVVVLSDATPLASATSGPTVLSVPWALDEYLDLFEAAIANNS